MPITNDYIREAHNKLVRKKESEIRLPLHKSHKIIPTKYVNEYDDYRLNSFIKKDDGWYFDGWNIARAIARPLLIPNLLNDTQDSWTDKNLDDLEEFIHSVEKAFHNRLGVMFHYTILFLIRELVQLNFARLRMGEKPFFSAAKRWSGWDTYCTAFLWVSYCYHSPEREQHPPTWHDFSLISGLDALNQLRYFSHIGSVIIQVPKLKEDVDQIIRTGWMLELSPKLGEAWYEGLMNNQAAVFGQLACSRGAHPAPRLRQILRTKDNEEFAMFKGPLPNTYEEYHGDPNKMGFRGPLKRAAEKYAPPPTPEQPPFSNDLYWDIVDVSHVESFKDEDGDMAEMLQLNFLGLKPKEGWLYRTD